MECNLVNVSAKGPGAVMVLPMHVICDCPAHGDETCSGRDGEKPSFREKYVDKIAESDATFAADHTRRFVKSQDPIEATTLNQSASCVQARISVTSAPAIGKQAAGLSCIEDLRNLVIPSWFVYMTVLGPWIAAPGKEMLRMNRG
jgi:hypothetical protein